MNNTARAVSLALVKSRQGKTIGVTKSKTFSTQPTPAAVDTYGWDTVYAMRFAELNNAIEQKGVTPPSFDQPDVPPPASYNYRVSGPFDAWRLATGGSGQLVCMELQIPTLTYEDTGASTSNDYDDVIATIKLRLEDLPQPETNDNVVDIRFPLAADGGDVIDSITMAYNGPTEPDTVAKIRIQTLLEQWLNDNCQDFDVVFASINLNAESATGDFDWLMPKHVSYAVRDDIFAILCMTETDSPSPTHDVSPDIIPAGSNSGFLISPARYLTNVILPNAYLLFDRASPDDFRMRNDGVLENKNKITLSRLETDDGKTFKPEVPIGGFTMRVTDNELVFKLENMRYNIPSKLGDYEVVMTHTSRGTASLNAAGQLMVDLASNETDGMIDASLKRRLIEIAIPVVTSVVLSFAAYALAARFAAGAAANAGAAAAGQAAPAAAAAGAVPRFWSMIGAIVGALAGGGYAAWMVVLEERAKNQGTSAPTLQTLLEDAVGSVTWAGGAEFDIRSAVLNNGLQIGVQNTPAAAMAIDYKEAANA